MSEPEQLVAKMTEALKHIPSLSHARAVFYARPEHAMTFGQFQAINQEEPS